MTKNKELVWRLKEQPTTENLLELVAGGIITKAEAREILLSTKVTSTPDKTREEMEEEIRFLRGLVKELSERKDPQPVVIREYIEQNQKTSPWYPKYPIWMKSVTAEFNGTIPDKLLCIGKNGTWMSTDNT